MAFSKNELQITWSAANSLSIAGGGAGTGTSDVFTFSSNAIKAWLQVKADNNGTPASGDTIDVTVELTGGDPDGAGANEYTSKAHSAKYQLDTNADDPAILLIEIPPLVAGKLVMDNNAASNGITVSALILEQLG